VKGEDGQTYTQWQGDGDIPTGSGWSDLRILASPHHHFARQLPCATRCQPCLPPPLSPRSRPSSRFPLRLIAAPCIKVSVENAGIVRGHAFVKGIVTATSNDGVSGAPAETATVPSSLCAARRRRCPSSSPRSLPAGTGYTTYRLTVEAEPGSVAVNVYTIFGDKTSALSMPPAYQIEPPFGVQHCSLRTSQSRACHRSIGVRATS
jgi:hypothetical protein